MSNLKLTVNGVDYDNSSGAWSSVDIIYYSSATPKVIANNRVLANGIYLLRIIGAGSFSGSAAMLQFQLYQEGLPSALEALIDMQLVINGIDGISNIL